MGSRTAECTLTWADADWCVPGVVTIPYVCPDILDCGAHPLANFTADTEGVAWHQSGVEVWLVNVNESVAVDTCLMGKNIELNHFSQQPPCELVEAERNASKPGTPSPIPSSTVATMMGRVSTKFENYPAYTTVPTQTTLEWPTSTPSPLPGHAGSARALYAPIAAALLASFAVTVYTTL